MGRGLTNAPPPMSAVGVQEQASPGPVIRRLRPAEKRVPKRVPRNEVEVDFRFSGRNSVAGQVCSWPLTSLTALGKYGRYRINSGQTAPSGLTGSAAFDQILPSRHRSRLIICTVRCNRTHCRTATVLPRRYPVFRRPARPADKALNHSGKWCVISMPRVVASPRITLRVKEEQRYSRGAQILPLREYLS